MELLISESCRISLDELRGNHYELVGPGGDLILPRVWEALIQPGWTVSIHFTETGPEPIPEQQNSSHQNTIHTLEERIARQEERVLRWEQERQREHERWGSERLAERLCWEAERQREWQRWIEERRLLDGIVASGNRRSRESVNQKGLCNISPCLCWLSGKRQVCP